MSVLKKYCVCIIAVLLSCTLIDDIGEQDNPFDPNGTNWIYNQPPVLYDNIHASPPWETFDYSDSTGSVMLAIYAYDPEEKLDTISYSIFLKEPGSDYTPHTFVEGDSSLTVAGVEAATTYYYRIIAFDRDTTNKNDTAEGSFVTPAGVPPKPPENATAGNLSYAVPLQWQCDLTAPVIIFRDTSLSGSFPPIDTVLDTAYFDTVDNYNLYYYMLATYNQYGKNFYPDTLSGRKYNSGLSPPPDPYWNKTAYLSSISIVVTFYTVNVGGNNVEGYEIFRASKPSGPYRKIGDTTVNIYNYFNFFDRNVPTTDNYYYKYSYLTNIGSSTFSNSVEAHLARLAAPSWISATYGTLGKHIRVVWNSVPDAKGYLLYRYKSSSFSSDTTFVDSLKSSLDTVYLDTPPTDSNYSYYVAAYSDAGHGDYSTYNNIGWILKIPYDVTLDTQNTTDSAIGLLWYSGGPSYQSTFIVYRSIDSTDSFSFVPVDTPSYPGSSLCFYADSTVPTGIFTRYYYRISRLDTLFNEESYQSTIIGGILAPAPYTDTLHTESFPDSVVLSWKPNPGASEYRLYRSLYEYADYQNEFHLAYITGDTTFTVTDSIDTIFYYRVTSANSSGEGRWIPGYGTPVTSLKIPVPGTVKAEGSPSHIKISLIDFTQTEGYLLYRSTDSLTGYTFLDSINAKKYRGDTAIYFDTILTADTVYYRARAYNPVGITDYSVPSRRVWRLKPEMTDSVYASDGTLSIPNSIQVIWHLVNGADNYILYRANSNTSNDALYFPIATTTTFDTVYYDTVYSDTIYYYRVKANNIAGQGSMSKKRDGGFRLPATAPDTVKNLSASTVYTDYIRVSWYAPTTGANFNGFYVYRSLTTDSLGDYIPIDTLPAHTTAINDYGATMTSPNKTWYKVSVFNIVGEGPTAGPVWGWKQ